MQRFLKFLTLAWVSGHPYPTLLVKEKLGVFGLAAIEVNLILLFEWKPVEPAAPISCIVAFVVIGLFARVAR